MNLSHLTTGIDVVIRNAFTMYFVLYKEYKFKNHNNKNLASYIPLIVPTVQLASFK